MFRENVFGLAAIVAAIFSIGGALAIVEAQQPPAGGPPVPTTSNKLAPGDPRAKAMTPPAGKAGMRMAPNTLGLGMPPPMGMGMYAGAGAGDDDPEMAELAQSEALLASQASEIISQYAETDNAAERKQIAAELRQTLARQFDVQKQRRELELSRIEERVRRLRDQIKRRDENRETIIDRRLAQLVDDAEGLGWTPPVGETRGRGKVKARSGVGSPGTP